MKIELLVVFGRARVRFRSFTQFQIEQKPVRQVAHFKPEQSKFEFDFYGVLRQVELENRHPKLRDIKFMRFSFYCSHFRHTRLCSRFFPNPDVSLHGISLSSRKVVSVFNREKERNDRISADLTLSLPRGSSLPSKIVWR